MIIANGAPKTGTTLLVSYLVGCGLVLEPGGLIATGAGAPLRMRGGKPWGTVRSLSAVMSDRSKGRVLGAHVRAGVALPGHVVIHIDRHPRNVFVSWARWVATGMDWTGAREPGPGVVQGLMTRDAAVDVIRRARAFAGWRGHAAVSVRFEALSAGDPATCTAIAEAAGVKPADPSTVIDGAAPWVTPSYRGTWSGRLSDWREVWSDTLDTIWEQEGGVAVEQAAGYSA